MAEKRGIDPPERRRTSRLGVVLHQLIARTNMRPSVLARRSGVSAATLTNLLRGHDVRGKPTFPNPDLLKQIAWGLGTNGLGERDVRTADEAYGKLMEAIGYLDTPSLVYAPPLPREVLDLLAANPDLTFEISQLAAGWSPEATEMLRQAIARYRTRKVQWEAPPDASAK